MSEVRYFQASARGNGVGVTILKHTHPQPGVVHTLVIHVLPKLWCKQWVSAEQPEVIAPFNVKIAPEAGGQFSSVQDPESSLYEHSDDGTLSLYVYETEILVLPKPWAGYLETVSGSALPPHDDDNEGGASDPLWTALEYPEKPVYAVAATVCGRVLGPATARENMDFSAGGQGTGWQKVSLLWRMLAEHHEEQAIIQGHRDITPQGSELFPHIPSLKEAMYRVFVDSSGQALAHRRPVFEPEVDELLFVRGRMLPRELVNRRINRRIGVVCEFDSLTTDTHLWQMIRAGLQQVATHAADNEVVDDALGYESVLRDVSTQNIRSLLTETLSPAFAMRLSAQTLRAYHYAQSILSQQYGFGLSDSPYEAGVLANIKFDTSSLWRKMLVRALTDTGLEVRVESPVGMLYHRNAEGRQQGVAFAKPDMMLYSRGILVATLDGRYTTYCEDLMQRSEHERYRMLAVAYRTGADGYTAYPVAGNGTLGRILTVGEPGAYPQAPMSAEHHVTTCGVRFPQPEDGRTTADASHLAKVLRKVPAEPS
ncbi:hypothetical protein ACLOJD_02765 [Rothia dentocariosa]|uniref:hypothetical protein n=1 Tax=Rothia dentocariosa TaxID=2047 RepID=UPI003A845F7C